MPKPFSHIKDFLDADGVYQGPDSHDHSMDTELSGIRSLGTLKFLHGDLYDFKEELISLGELTMVYGDVFIGGNARSDHLLEISRDLHVSGQVPLTCPQLVRVSRIMALNGAPIPYLPRLISRGTRVYTVDGSKPKAYGSYIRYVRKAPPEDLITARAQHPELSHLIDLRLKNIIKSVNNPF